MDMEYFRDQICEELDGAKDYAMQAIELKPMAPIWGKALIDMANMEIGHANNLYKMMNEYYQKISGAYTEIPDYIEKLHKEATECYVKESLNAKNIIEMYSK